MIHKTEGIVLRTLKHQDANLITTLYTREFGIRSFIIKGYRSARSRSRHSYFQPLSIIDILFLEKGSRNLQKITESHLSRLLHTVQTDPVKLALGLTMMEIFFDTVKEEESNFQLYDFLRQSILYLDQAERRLIQIFIWFLVRLTAYLGFFPNDESDEAKKIEFRLNAGTFHRTNDSGDSVAFLFRKFVHCQLDNCQEITFDSAHKRHLLKLIFDYYTRHIEGFKYPQSLKVFSEVFGGID